MHQPSKHFIYLHGFASSPDSRKARFLVNLFASRGLKLHCPDLNQPNFSTLTVTRMIGQVSDLLSGLPSAPTVLIGSSLGAFVVLHIAERSFSETISVHPIEKMILLSPALNFGKSGMHDLGYEQYMRWRESGWLEVMHHTYGELYRVHYELYSNASNYDSFATETSIQTLVLQGQHDEVVDPEMVKRFADTRSHVRLVMLNDDHKLSVSLNRVWSEIEVFLGLDQRQSWFPSLSQS